MGKEHAQQINLVAHPGAGREVAHVAVRLGLTEDPFLSTAPFAKLQHLTSRQALVREDDLEVVAVLVRDEEIELHRLLVLAAHFGADEQQAPAVVLAFRFPEEFEVGHFITQPVPTLAGLGSLLELDQACEGHAHGVLNPRRLELAQDGVAIRWLRSVALGHYRYFAVPYNLPPLLGFRCLNWQRFWQIVDRWLLPPRIYHPWSNVRFRRHRPRQKPYGSIAHVRFRTGGARQLALLP